MPITPERFAQMSLEQAKAGLDAGEFSPGELLEASFARMDAFEPVINAVITRCDGLARKSAAAARDSAKQLAGLPVAVKDCIMTRGIRSTCGSRILDAFVPPHDATVVKKIIAAGGYPGPKTNMDEFAMGSSGETSAFGPARNPWNPARVPGGSSSGSAALVAYGGALASLGSDTGGSIRLPAAFCGLVGMKPTYGRVSRNGVGPMASSLDQVGPLARGVRDNALLLDVISGHDPLDPTSAARADSAAPCLPGIEDGVNGLRIGYDPAILARESLSPVMDGAVRRALGICRDNGAEVREITIPLIDYADAAYYIINFCEGSTNLTRFDGVRYGTRRGDGDLWEIYRETRGQGFGDEVKRRIMMGSYALSKGYYDAYYLKAARVRRLLAERMAALFADVDAIVMPVAPQPPGRLGAAVTVLDAYLSDIFTLPANLSGLPAIAFPVGVFDGLPAGVQAIGRPFGENILYRVARVAEKNTVLPGAPWTKAIPETAK